MAGDDEELQIHSLPEEGGCEHKVDAIMKGGVH